MPSTQELFGDDSSDDDNVDESKEAATTDKDPSPEPTAAASDEGKSKSDLDTEPPKEGETEEAGQDDKDEQYKPPPVAQRRGALDDSEDDDDDAPQFNDDGVVGLKSKTLAGHIVAKSASESNRSLNADGEEDEDDGVTYADPDQPARPKEPPQPTISTKTMIVQPSTAQPITKMYFTKLPNILGVQTEAFSPDNYSAAAEEEDYGQAAYNLIRWRYQTDSIGHVRRTNEDSDDVDEQKLIRESNTRLVEWEDGSFTLHVGTEVFNVDLTDSSTPQGFAGLNGYLYLSQSATFKDSATAVTDEEGNEEAANEVSAGTVLECMGPMASRMVVRPSSLQSEAHKSLTVGIRQKTIKKARIAEFVTQEDPEKLKQERIKVKDDLEKAAFRKNRGSYPGSGGGGYNRSSPGRPRMSREYLEDDRDFDTTNIKAMKRRTMGGDEGMDDYGDDSDDYDDDNDETFRKVRPGGRASKALAKSNASAAAAAAKRAESDDDEDEMFMGGDDDDDDDGPVAKAKPSNKKRSHQAVVDDDDSD